MLAEIMGSIRTHCRYYDQNTTAGHCLDTLKQSKDIWKTAHYSQLTNQPKLTKFQRKLSDKDCTTTSNRKEEMKY